MCKMRKFELFRKVFVLCGVFFCFASCDTRDDYILEHCDEPVITLVNPEKWGSEEIFNQKYVAVDLSWGDSVELDFNFEDKYGISGDFSYEIKGSLNSTALYEYYTDGSDEYDDVYKTVESVGNHLSVEMDSDNRKIIIKEKTKSAEYFYEKLAPYWTVSVSNPIDMSSGGTALVSARITLKIKNKIGKEGLFYVYLQVWANRAPTPNFVFVADSDNNMIKGVKAVCEDIDGDEIVAYEYNFDGEVFSPFTDERYDFVNKSTVNNVKTGDAAYGGVYLTATALPYVKHVFQEEGEHVVHVRCKDSWGLWSEWCSKKIKISK